MNPLMQLKNIEVVLEKRKILEIEALDINCGEILTVLGPTGSGKSTILKLLAFLIKPRQGEIFWQGQQVYFPAPLCVRRLISMTFQEPLPFQGTVFENVAYGLRIRGVKGKELKRKVEETLELLGIEHLKNHSARRISGGEAQRMALARALVFHPLLLLLDEPLASLDPLTKDKLKPELYRILKQIGMTCVYVTHDQEEAYFFSDRIAVLDQGKILQVGNKERIFFKPSNAKVAKFVGTENLIPAVVCSQENNLVSLKVGDKTLEAIAPFPPGKKVIACIRPEEITLKKDGVALERVSARNQLPGTIISLDSFGPVAKATLDCGFTLKVLITRRSVFDLNLNPGDFVVATFKATAVHVFSEDEGEANDQL